MPWAWVPVVIWAVLATPSRAITNSELVPERGEIALLILSDTPLNLREYSRRELNQFSSCTAAFVGPAKLLTAGHCVVGESGRLNVYLAVEHNNAFTLIPLSRAQTSYVFETLEDSRAEGSICHTPNSPLPRTSTPDVALVEVSSPYAASWLELSDHAPQFGDTVEVYGRGSQTSPFTGHGAFSARDFGLRRFSTTVSKVSSQRIGMIADPMSPFASDGDSGGPVLFAGKIIGVTSTVSEHCETEFGSDYGILNTATLTLGLQLSL